MNAISTWDSIFTQSSFFCLKKDEELDLSYEKLLSRFDTEEIANFHPNRKNEFLLGRVCASKAYEMQFGEELLSLSVGLNRSPLWPEESLGSISHNQYWVGAAVSKANALLGVGIDFEIMGRAKLELSRHIRSAEDLLSHQSLDESELLTIIFSAKEALYKALYPTAKCFFGFEVAAVREIDISKGTFKIDLVSDICSSLGPSSRFQFEGRFKIIGETCLTVLEIPH